MSREQIQTWFNEFFEFSTKDRSTVTSVSCKLFGEHVFNKQQERILELEQELTKSTDQNDLVLDEFIRVKCLTDNTEIHQLCERAHIRMRQRVSVIDRNYKLQKRIAELEKAQNQLLSLIYNSAVGNVAMGYPVDIEGIASEAYEITGINAEQAKSADL